VDDNYRDTVLYWRPTNAWVLGWATEAGSLGWEYGVGALVTPIVCVVKWLSGDGCDLDDGVKLAREYNAVDYVEGLIPGIGMWSDDTMTGLWHFLHVDSRSNRFNDHRGMWYIGAGPDGPSLTGLGPGAFDLVIIAFADVTGLSLDAGRSDGDDRYGDHDEISRGDAAWQAHSIAHLEFSPVDNLALYGWDRYSSEGFQTATGLGWPLHAIGDVFEPHHVVGTTSYGHRPYEDYVDEYVEDILPFDQAQFRDEIVLRGFYWWKTFKDDPDIRAYVTLAAFWTRQRVRELDDWAYSDTTSIQYHTGFSAAAIDAWIGDESKMQDLTTEAAAATLAFLVHASTKVVDPGLDPTIKCPPDTHFDFSSIPSCVPGAPPPTPDAGGGVCPLAGDCGGAGTGGTQDAGCFMACGTMDSCPISYLCHIPTGCCRPDPR